MYAGGAFDIDCLLDCVADCGGGCHCRRIAQPPPVGTAALIAGDSCWVTAEKAKLLRGRPSQGAERIEISGRRVTSYATHDAKEIAKLLTMLP